MMDIAATIEIVTCIVLMIVYMQYLERQPHPIIWLHMLHRAALMLLAMAMLVVLWHHAYTINIVITAAPLCLLFIVKNIMIRMQGMIR